MTIAMQPIYTQTVGSGGAASITFNNIPQTFTDLMLQISARSTKTSSVSDSLLININGSSSNQSSTFVQGTGSGVASTRTSLLFAGELSSNTATSNTFGTAMIYIPNYVSSNFKSFIQDSVSENNATTALQSLWANLWSNTAAVTSLTFYFFGGSITQHSTFTLYGITKG